MKTQTSETQSISHILSSEEISFLLHPRNTDFSEKKESLFQKILERSLAPQIQPLFSQTLRITTEPVLTCPISNSICIFNRKFFQYSIKASITPNTQEALLTLCLGFYSPRLVKNTNKSDLQERLITLFQSKFECGINRFFNNLSEQEIKNLPADTFILLQIGTTEIKIHLHTVPLNLYTPQKTKVTIQLASQKFKLQNILTWQKGTFVPLNDLGNATVAEIVTPQKTIAQADVKIKDSQITLNSIKEVD